MREEVGAVCISRVDNNAFSSRPGSRLPSAWIAGIWNPSLGRSSWKTV